MTDTELNTLSTPPSQDKGEALAEELERLREEVDRFRRPRDRALSTEDPITPLDSFQPRHLLGLALLFRQWCDSGLWGRPEEAELAARQVETAYSMLTALSAAQASERKQIAAWLRRQAEENNRATEHYQHWAGHFADAIERGDHLATPVEPSPADVERVALAAENARLRAAALAVLAHRVDGPTRGWLRDNQASREALDGLSAALQSPPVEQPAQAEAQQPSEAVVEHIAAILEEWDMKQPPDPFTGHDYRDIARDILTRIDAHLSNITDQGSDQHG